MVDWWLHGRWRHEASWRRRRTGGERAASLNMRVRVMARARAWSDVDGAVRGGTGRGRIERHGPVGDISCQCHRNWSGFHHARVWTRAAKGRRRDSEPDRLTEKKKRCRVVSTTRATTAREGRPVLFSVSSWYPFCTKGWRTECKRS